MIRDPIITVECDKCGYEEGHWLTRTGKGWDDRGMENSLRHVGWLVENDGLYTVCPACMEQMNYDKENPIE